jgi:hypothetical protein
MPPCHSSTGEWEHTGEGLRNLYSCNIIKAVKLMIRWTGHVACFRLKRYVYRILFGEPQRKKPLETPCYEWEEWN